MTITAMHLERIDTVAAVLEALGAKTVLDLGCGDGPLIARLAETPGVERIVGIDSDPAALALLEAQLAHRPRAIDVELRAGDLLAPDPGLAGSDAAVLVEVIEHLEPTRLSVLETALFGTLRPRAVVLTTPNADFNELLRVPRHRYRHPDHRFEWGRGKFRAWARGVARRWGQAVSFRDLGAVHPALGGSSQMAVFRRVGVPGAPQR